jgi:hypothetical protein
MNKKYIFPKKLQMSNIHCDYKNWIKEIDKAIKQFPSIVLSTIIVDYLKSIYFDPTVCYKGHRNGATQFHKELSIYRDYSTNKITLFRDKPFGFYFLPVVYHYPTFTAKQKYAKFLLMITRAHNPGSSPLWLREFHGTRTKKVIINVKHNLFTIVELSLEHKILSVNRLLISHIAQKILLLGMDERSESIQIDLPSKEDDKVLEQSKEIINLSHIRNI